MNTAIYVTERVTTSSAAKIIKGDITQRHIDIWRCVDAQYPLFLIFAVFDVLPHYFAINISTNLVYTFITIIQYKVDMTLMTCAMSWAQRLRSHTILKLNCFCGRV